MFRGTDPELGRAMGRAVAAARGLAHPRTGSEHLLLALTDPRGAVPDGPRAAAGDPPQGEPCAGAGQRPRSEVAALHDRVADEEGGPRAAAGRRTGEAPTEERGSGAVAAVLGSHGVTTAAVREAVCRAAPLGAGAAADRDALAPFGIDLDRLGLTPAVLDRAPLREPLLPLGAAKARRWCAQKQPPLGLDAQAAFEASLRLALARRERDHRPEHLALVLVALDPGAAWILDAIGADASALLAGLQNAFPPPGRNALLRAERRIGRNSRGADLIRRYQRTTGRVVRQAGAVTALIAG
ncbi:Clp protease N-terminal domain-containing protein [Dactylosporangium sp. NPDC005572]|uniref:Clp protease N-terminal domain-containing protein n=1 Tax=Dactylosporangium sp. NPDC005572 TaxID=3156889 RepID=UPI0033B34362